MSINFDAFKFKRLNFFKGLFTTAADWTQEQAYHLGKRRLHNRDMHTSGVASGLSVQVTTNDRFRVQKGYAIDGHGRDLYLNEPQPYDWERRRFAPGATIYIVMEYDESFTDRRIGTKPDYSGEAFVEERPRVTVTAEKPDNHEKIELARVKLGRAGPVRNPRDGELPKENEIDTRFVKRAGAAPAKLVTWVDNGTMNVNPGDEGRGVDYVETVLTPSAHRAYVADVYPDPQHGGDAMISWEIRSLPEHGGVKYRLYIRNHGNKSVVVHYRVYRLDLYELLSNPKGPSGTDEGRIRK